MSSVTNGPGIDWNTCYYGKDFRERHSSAPPAFVVGIQISFTLDTPIETFGLLNFSGLHSALMHD